jgi:glycosyltransferase involved in cell wall biosynthesis
MRNEFDLNPVPSFRRLVQREQYDIVHFHTKRAHALALWLGRGSRAKTVVTRRMDYPMKRSWYNRYLYNRKTDGVVAISRRIAEILVEGGVHEDRVRVIHSGVDPDLFGSFSFPGWDGRTLTVGTVAVLVKRKGHRFLLEAAAIIKQRGFKLRYQFAGDGPEKKELEKLVAQLGLEEEVSFSGFLPDVAAFLANVDIFVLPSLYEGLGVAVLEAMAAGKPIVTSRVGGIPELIRDRECGLLVPAGRAESLADAICLLLSQESLAERMGRRAWQKVREEFTLEEMGNKNETFYYELLQHGQS